MTVAGHPRVAAGAGIGLRQPHYAEALEQAPPLAFVEVHSENFFADGGAALAVLHAARERWPVSLHGVGMALGSAAGVDPWHLERLSRLVQRIEPVRVSDHACFARAPLAPGAAVVHGSDLLPLAFAPAALDILVANVVRVQERLRRPMLVENLSAYVAFDDDRIAEPEFLAALVRRSGCSLLLDVNNLMVNALNAGTADPLAACRAFVDALPLGCVGELQVAGHAQGEGLVIDDHGSRVSEAVWALHAHALERFPGTPTLVEWDTDIPDFAVLLAEADRAARSGATR